MNNNLLLKCLIAFFIGVIVYKLVSDRCSSNIVEGQCLVDGGSGECVRNNDNTYPDGNTASGRSDCSPGADGDFCSITCDPTETDSPPDNEMCGCCKWSIDTPGGGESGQSRNITDVISSLNIYFGDNSNNQLQTLLNHLAEISGTQQNEDILNNISSLSDIGDSVNTETLDYIELIVRNTMEVENQELKTRISTRFYDNRDLCGEDIYLNIMAFMILIYNNTINKDEFVNIINTSDRLSKYVPKLFNKLEELYEDCPKNPNSSNYYKSLILSSVFNKLFKNNTTVINVKGFSNLMESLENVKTIYIVLFMICFTYIAVKFMGMFNMKLNM